MKDILVLDIGGTHIKIGCVTDGRHLELGRHYSTALLRKGDPVDGLARLVNEVCEEMDLRPDAVVSTVPGFLDPDLDYIHSAGNIPELNGRRLASELSACLAIPVYLERDSILLLKGEWSAGAGRNSRQLLGLFFGTGVGAAFLQDGSPFRGSGFAMEIGSMPFKGLGRTMEGLRPDCLETYVSGRVLAELANRHGIAIENLFADADIAPGLRADIDQFVRDMAMATAVAIALFSPDTTVVGGGICNMRGFPLDRLRALTAEIAPVSETGRKLNLKWAELGWKAAVFGALLRAEEGGQRSQERFSSSRPGAAGA